MITTTHRPATRGQMFGVIGRKTNPKKDSRFAETRHLRPVYVLVPEAGRRNGNAGLWYLAWSRVYVTAVALGAEPRVRLYSRKAMLLASLFVRRTVLHLCRRRLTTEAEQFHRRSSRVQGQTVIGEHLPSRRRNDENSRRCVH